MKLRNACCATRAEQLRAACAVCVGLVRSSEPKSDHLLKLRAAAFRRLPERFVRAAVGPAHIRHTSIAFTTESTMTRTILAAACALALSTSFALAQPSQAQGGGSTGPTSNSATSTSDQKGGAMSKSGTSTSGTTGATGTTSGSPQAGTGPAGQNTNPSTK
jgi:hypothetical protein